MTHEQTALLNKARESLRAAKLLIENGLYDFAASRAYYTMFYIAEAFLLGEGLVFSKHSAVISAFGKHFAKTGIVPEEYHYYLIESQDRRNIGDYDIETGISEAQAVEQIAHAELFVDLAKRTLK